jgi:GxxExxY protein
MNTAETFTTEITEGTERIPVKPVVIPVEVNAVSGAVVDAAFRVHTELGPGLLESAYETCLSYELRQRGLKVCNQVELPVVYCGKMIDCSFRLDLVVADCVIVEVKAVEQLHKVHAAQLLTYLKLSGLRVGLLINFNVTAIKTGIKRIAV